MARGGAQSERSSARDVVFTLGFNSWSSAAAAGFSFPEERLAAALVDDPRVEHLLVCDPLRSAARKLARAILGRSGSPFIPTATAAHHGPVRLRRADPVEAADVERVYQRYERGIRRAAVRQGLKRPVIVTGNPLLAGFGDFAWAGPITYYAWDDWTASEPLRRWWPVYEQAFARLRDQRRGVVAVSDAIIERIAPTGPHAIVRNGIDPAEWARLPAPPRWFSELPGPRLLYVGSLESRLDIGQITRLAGAFRAGSIALVGRMHDPAHFAPLRVLPNVVIHPAVARTDVPALVGHADVGIIPHVRSRLTEAMSPLKLYEYLAGGRPVAAVELPGIVGVSDRVFIASLGGDLVTATRRALAAGPASEHERMAFVAENSWARRFDALLELALTQCFSP